MTRAGTIAVILKGYPRLSETFIAQELLGLEQAGLQLHLYSMRRPTDGKVHPIHHEIAAPVVYLPEYLHEAPLRVLRGLWRAVRLPGFRAALGAFLHDLPCDVSRNRFRRLGQAAVLAAELPPGIDRLYAHFIHTPSAVTRYASLMTGLPWSCSAHAKDIWTSPDWELAANLSAVAWAVTCTATGRDRLAALAPRPDTVRLVYHGLDLGRFPPNPAPPSRRDGRDPADPVRLIAVGRAVEKKGFDLLLDAVAALPPDCAWSLTHIGGGAEAAGLKEQARRLGIADRITWMGAQDQQTVLAAYRSADLFVLPCRIAGNGDRDGLPNVLVEAQSQRLACLSTAVAGIPELITDRETGVLVPPEDRAALAQALAALVADPDRRAALASAGEARVRAAFDARAGLQQLVMLFGGAVPTAAARTPAEAQP